jgi:hypothetical protein
MSFILKLYWIQKLKYKALETLFYPKEDIICIITEVPSPILCA